jgi:hypothetical protein
MKMSNTQQARQIRLISAFGQFSVEGLDNNGVWVSIEPGSCSFASREEAEDYISRWIDLNDDMERVEDVSR